MGEVTAAPWEQFTGAERLFPVEFFLQAMENEFTDQTELCRETILRISSDRNCPAGVWKSKRERDALRQMRPYLECSTGEWKSQSPNIQTWRDVKSSLLKALGRNGKPYTIEDKLEFLLSLRKRAAESRTAFLFRVKWVVTSVIGSSEEKIWTKLLFLIGLSETERASVVSESAEEIKEEDDLMSLLIDNNLPSNLGCDVESQNESKEQQQNEPVGLPKLTSPETQTQVSAVEPNVTEDLLERLDGQENQTMVNLGCNTAGSQNDAEEQQQNERLRFTKSRSLETQITKGDQEVTANTMECTTRRITEQMASVGNSPDTSKSENVGSGKPLNDDESENYKSNEKRRYKCPSCPKVFTNHESMTKHRRRLHLKKLSILKHKDPVKQYPNNAVRYHCSICTGVFLSRTAFTHHMKNQHEHANSSSKPVAVPQNNHEKQSTGVHDYCVVKYYRCSRCQRIFSKKDSFQNHSCKYSPKRYTESNNLDTHIEVMHRGATVSQATESNKESTAQIDNGYCVVEYYECLVCKMIFRTKDILQNHRCKAHKCNICLKRFAQSCDVDMHIWNTHGQHIGEKRFQCPVCKIEFANEGTLDYHMKCQNHVQENSISSQNNKGVSEPNASSEKTSMKEKSTIDCLKMPQSAKTVVLDQRKVSWTNEQENQNNCLTNASSMSEKNWLKCSVCTAAFEDKERLTRHHEKHAAAGQIAESVDKKYKCSVCFFEFANEGTLKLHIRSQNHAQESSQPRHSSTEGNSVPNTDTNSVIEKSTLDSPRMPQTAKPVVLDQRKVSCTNEQENPNNCSKNASSLSEGYWLKCSIKKYKCPVCLFVFANEGTLKFHIKSQNHTQESSQPRYSDTERNSEPNTATETTPFTDKSTLDSPKMHQDEASKALESGPQISPTPTASGLSGSMDNFPDKRLQNRERNSKNLKQKEPKLSLFQTLKKYKCNVCQKRFGDNSLLKIHMRTHKSKTEYECDVCSKSFSNKSNLTRHKRVRHTKMNTDKSLQCPKRYDDVWGLTEHLKTQQLHQADFQAQESTNKIRSQEHQRVEEVTTTTPVLTTENSPENDANQVEITFQCILCSKNFSRETDLEIHIETHT